MLDPAIQNFLDDRREAWLKKNIKTNASDEDKAELERQGAEIYSLPVWLPNAALRASQLSLVSHPAKFSHPSAKTSSVIATAERRADGFLRTGNVDVELDVFGNAAALDVYKFLSLTLADNQTVLSHLENKTPQIEAQLTVATALFSEIEQGLLGIKQDDDSLAKTNDKVKQIYFPVDDDYHLLSVLTPSNVMYETKQRINTMRFSEEAKEARNAKKNNQHHAHGLAEIYGLSVIGFGGTKPQNISVLNSKNHGEAYLLSSMPPELTARTLQPPRRNFFSDTLWAKTYQDDFESLHKLFIADVNNIHIRKGRDRLCRQIIYQVIDRLWLVRHLPPAWSQLDRYQQLPQHQKIWLDQAHRQAREGNADWLDNIKNDFSRWFSNTYTTLLGKKALSIGDEQWSYFKSMLDECEEALR